MFSSLRLIFISGVVVLVVLVVFAFFGYLFHLKIVEFIHAFELAFGISLGILMWLKQKFDW